MNQIICGDCLSVMPTLPENSVDSIITDPPYGLDFMGKSWDHGVPGVEFWQAALRVAKPGAILMAFGGTRTYHRLACAIEDAGWELRDTMCWLYGSGFPKSLDISKAIDKGAPREGMFLPFACHYAERRVASGLTHTAICEAGKFYDEQNHGGASVNWEKGYNVPTLVQWRILQPLLGLSPEWLPLIERVEAEREVVGQRDVPIGHAFAGETYGGDSSSKTVDVTLSATPAAHLWQGWGTALKPAWEPIIVAMKPLEGTYAENAQKWGVAGLNIDGGRIGTEDSLARPFGYGGIGSKQLNAIPHGTITGEHLTGRWPANLLLDEISAKLLDEQSGELGKSQGGGNGMAMSIYGSDVQKNRGQGSVGFGDSGGASRFFYTAKASSSERNAGLEDLRLTISRDYRTGNVNKMREDGGRTPDRETHNNHPTVKPLSLMRYLCKLTRTPTGGVVLDPFMGSGTTGIACVLEHRDFIGIEIDENYAEIARKRIADMTGPLFIPPEVKHGDSYLYNSYN